jgi:hypothetical protein
MATLLNGKTLGLSQSEKQKYSLSKAILGAATNNYYSTEGLEGECHRALYESLDPSQKAASRGLLIPAGDLDWGGSKDRSFGDRSRSVLNTGSFSSGGALVSTDHLGDNFIESLRSRSRVLSLGVTMLPGRVGNVEIPKESGANSEVYWISENDQIPDTTVGFGNLEMSPKTCGSIASFTRNMLIQADPAIENILKANMLNSMAIGIDKALLFGDGNKEPLGIFNHPDVASVAAGTNGGPLSYELLADMEAEIYDGNADSDSMAWIVNSRVRRSARTTTENSSNVSQWIWQNGSNGDGLMLGHKAVLSNNLPKNLTKGSGTNLSSLIFGNWSSLIFANWSTIELVSNPYGRGWQTGAIELRILYSVDSAIRHGESFCVCSDLVTA